MSCNHTAGVNIRADLLIERDHLTDEVVQRTLDVLSITCSGCGARYSVGDGEFGFAVRLEPSAAPPAVHVEPPPAVTAEDFETLT